MRGAGRLWARRGALAAAATAGSAAVGSAAVAFCDAPAPKAPPFVLGGDRYDQKRCDLPTPHRTAPHRAVPRRTAPNRVNLHVCALQFRGSPG